jgi:hypothetical protein
VQWIRANVNWAGLEPDAKGTINAWLLAEYDYAIDRARAAGLEVLMPISDGVPYWASADPAKHVDGQGRRRYEVTYRPAKASDYGDIVAFVVERYSARGVHAYQIWNEPNHPRFWPSGPKASEYVPMLRAGYEAVKAVDPGALVLLGGLSKSDFYYLEDVYRAGGGPYFDAVAVHPYTYGVDPTAAWNGVHSWEDKTRISINAFPAIQEIKRSMDAFGDSHKKVWLTEFGYSTTTRDGGVSAQTQAEFLTKAYRYVERFPWVETLFWYAARNSPFYGDADTYEGRFGLTTTDFTPKPSYAALKAYAQPKVRLVKGAQRALPRGGRARVVLHGRVRGAGGGRPALVIQKRTARGWVRVKEARVGSAGAFRTQVTARGRVVRYRAVARDDGARVRSRVVRVTVRR